MDEHRQPFRIVDSKGDTIKGGIMDEQTAMLEFERCKSDGPRTLLDSYNEVMGSTDEDVKSYEGAWRKLAEAQQELELTRHLISNAIEKIDKAENNPIGWKHRLENALASIGYARQLLGEVQALDGLLHKGGRPGTKAKTD